MIQHKYKIKDKVLLETTIKEVRIMHKESGTMCNSEMLTITS